MAREANALPETHNTHSGLPPGRALLGERAGTSSRVLAEIETGTGLQQVKARCGRTFQSASRYRPAVSNCWLQELQPRPRFKLHSMRKTSTRGDNWRREWRAQCRRQLDRPTLARIKYG